MVKFDSIGKSALYKTALVGAAILGVGLSLNSCKPDIILPVPRGIEGDYSGQLFITENALAGGTKVTDSMPVRVVFRLGEDEREQAGTYAHIYDTLNGSDSLPEIFCSISQGTWFTRDGKIFLSPGEPIPSVVCNPSLIPNSFIELAGGGVTLEVGFGPTKLKLPVDAPDENEIGDTLVLRQVRNDADMETVFRLELLTIP